MKKCMQLCIAGSMLALFCVAFVSATQKKSIFASSPTARPAEQAVQAQKKPIKILFVGDMMFDRYIRQIISAKGQDFILQKAQTILQGNDLVVGNLEGPITQNASVSIASKMGERNNYIFTFDPNIADVLIKHNIMLVSMGNNHITNFGSDGIAQTRNFLTQAGVRYFGDPENQVSNMAIEKFDDHTIVLVNYNQFSSGSQEAALNSIQTAKRSGKDFVVVYAHWGTEYVSEPSDAIRGLAHTFIDAGADVIIGTHPHVIQSKEKYQGKMIYYSLGNFIFDQYFEAKTKKGLAVRMDIDERDAISFTEFSVRMDSNGQTVAEN